MKIEIRCQDCGKSWLVDEKSSGGAMICSNCLAHIRLPAERWTADPPAPVAAGKGAARPAARSEDETEGAPQNDLAAQEPQGVVCPRCRLHFSPRERPPAEVPDERKTVLVVEDLDYFRQVAADALSQAYEVRTASTAAEARAALAAGGIDLLLLDLTLDGGDAGRTLLGELRPKPCPVLIYTAQDESDLYGDQWAELVELGADDLVIKGMNVGESLLRKVGLLLGAPVDEETRVR
jgi:CheY-like chemotaxis protein